MYLSKRPPPTHPTPSSATYSCRKFDLQTEVSVQCVGTRLPSRRAWHDGLSCGNADRAAALFASVWSAFYDEKEEEKL